MDLTNMHGNYVIMEAPIQTPKEVKELHCSQSTENVIEVDGLPETP